MYVVKQESLFTLHVCLLTWSTDPTKPLPIPVILPVIFRKGGEKNILRSLSGGEGVEVGLKTVSSQKSVEDGEVRIEVGV